MRVTAELARRLAVSKQRLVGPRPASDADGVHGLVRELGCVQIDPTSAVARTELLVLWSRLGAYDTFLLDTLLWRERRLFVYWAHAASIVPSEDFRLHESTLMRLYARDDTVGDRREREWLAANTRLRRSILRELRERGPLRARDFDATLVQRPWLSSGWTNERTVQRLLASMWASGEALVAGRAGNERLWDLPERCLPREALAQPRLRLETAVRDAAERSLRSLGVATPKQIRNNFIRGRYPGLDAALARLERGGRIRRVETEWPGTWFVHVDDLPLVERLAAGEWEPRTSLLSPFDNLICDRERTSRVFEFDFRIEIYVPAAKRRYGYFVMPILHGDRIVARIDPRLDRRAKRLDVHAVHVEAGAESDGAAAEGTRNAIARLASFVGAESVAYGRIPHAWRRALASA